MGSVTMAGGPSDFPILHVEGLPTAERYVSATN